MVLDNSFRADPVFQRKLRWSTFRDNVVYRFRVLQVLHRFYGRMVLEGGIAGQIERSRKKKGWLCRLLGTKRAARPGRSRWRCWKPSRPMSVGRAPACGSPRYRAARR